MNDLNSSLTEVNRVDRIDDSFFNTRKRSKCYENK